MYRTDKQFMKNPATVASRVYIGGLPKGVIALDLEQKFSPHGKILGLHINAGFAFIQYEFEEEAQSAIRSENGSVMMGRKIIVRQAFAGTSNPGAAPAPVKGPLPKVEAPPARGPPPVAVPPPQLENEPPLAAENRNLQFEPPENNEVELEEEPEAPPSIRPPPPQPVDDRSRRGGRGGGNMGRGGGGRNHSMDRFDDRFDTPPRGPGAFPDRGPVRPGAPAEFFNDYGPPHTAAILEAPPDRNDCEIIVVSRVLTEYAEYIESRLKRIGLTVDLLFPNEDVPIGKVLANISSRGCLYAMLVMPQNEEHRSLTLNILHGIPQEHRNMPIDDALLLTQRNFEAYMRGEKAPEDPIKMNLADRHPNPMQLLLNLLAENRMISSAQYDRVIKYLQERRELQCEHEVSEGIAQEDSNDAPKDKQNELQSRIMNILNKSNETPIPTSITAPEPTKEPTPLLKDPSVQKALDSILSGDMFKGMTGAM